MPTVRLLLIVNARAGTVTPRKVRFIERALGDETKVERVDTRRRGHATELARGAAEGTHDVVVVVGGDGTINEAVNGLAGSDVGLGIIPGGGTNVLARSLGVPPDPLRAAGHLLARLRAPARRIPLGRADGRYFTFACGMGLDGEIVRQVERRQALKKAAGHGFFLWTALRVGLFDYDLRTPRLEMRWGRDLEHHAEGLVFAICQNLDPFSYLTRLPLHICPRAGIDLGLDCLAARPLGRLRTVRWATQTLGSARHVRDRRAVYLHDQRRIHLRSEGPLPVQMDGEFLGRRDHLELESIPEALAIYA